jgi:DNA-binding PucR family transcriptional regulator
MATRAGTARATTLARLERASGDLSTAAIARMDATLPWFREMPAESRSWVNLIAQDGVAAFLDWFRAVSGPATEGADAADPATPADIFGNAPRELVRAITFQQTVDLIRVTIEVVEEHVAQIAPEGSEGELRESVLRYSREVAFAAALVYAQAAEARGAWDARLEALVVDALLRGEVDEGVRSRAAALGWSATGAVVVVVGHSPAGSDPEAVVEGVQRAARHARLAVLAGVQGERLVAVLGDVDDPTKAAKSLLGQFGPGAVVVGPVVTDLLLATASAEAAIAGLRAAVAWPDAPRPVAADDLLAERALAGDRAARDRLVETVYRPLTADDGVLLETAAAFLERAPSLEASARHLFVHANTVRYRLRRIADVTGLAPTDPRGAATLRVAMTLGRLSDAGALL